MTPGLVCLIWGHAVDNHVFADNGRACTRCGKALLRDDPAPVRVGHTLSCFLRHHTYEPVGARDGHMEYACMQCGHPLLFPLSADPYNARNRFQKRVRYLCGLFGHQVHRVAERNGGVEYACHCGHSFVHQPDRKSLGPSSNGVRAARALGIVRPAARSVQRVRLRDLRPSVPVCSTPHASRSCVISGRHVVEADLQVGLLLFRQVRFRWLQTPAEPAPQKPWL